MKNPKTNEDSAILMVATVLVLVILLSTMTRQSSDACQPQARYDPTTATEKSSHSVIVPETALSLHTGVHTDTVDRSDQYFPVAHEMIRSNDGNENIWTGPQGEQAVLLPILTLCAEKGDLRGVRCVINVNGRESGTFVFGVTTQWYRIYPEKSSDYLGYKDSHEVAELGSADDSLVIGIGDMYEGTKIELSIAVWVSSDGLSGIEKIDSTDVSIDVVVSADNLEKSEKTRLL